MPQVRMGEVADMYKVVCKDGYANSADAQPGTRTAYAIPL
jgi:hypothetical protein